MNKLISTKLNRVWIILNTLSLIAGLTIFYGVKIFSWPLIVLFSEILILALFLISFFKAFIRTKSWKMVHSSFKNLDEREMQVVLHILKVSYATFAIICLLIIYAFAILDYHPIDVVIAGGLLYLAHALPAALVAWNEKSMSE